MNSLAAKLAADLRHIGHRLHRAPFQRYGSFVLLLAMVVWSYEMLTFVPAPLHAVALPPAAGAKPAPTIINDQAPEPDPSANAIAAFDSAPT